MALFSIPLCSNIPPQASYYLFKKDRSSPNLITGDEMIRHMYKHTTEQVSTLTVSWINLQFNLCSETEHRIIIIVMGFGQLLKTTMLLKYVLRVYSKVGYSYDMNVWTDYLCPVYINLCDIWGCLDKYHHPVNNPELLFGKFWFQTTKFFWIANNLPQFMVEKYLR